MLGTLAQVAIGGALGAMARFGTQSLPFRFFGPGFPPGSRLVNGLAAARLIDRDVARYSPAIVVGFLGAWSSFSTNAMDTLHLWKRGELALGGSLFT